jgi:hypothetical protein
MTDAVNPRKKTTKTASPKGLTKKDIAQEANAIKLFDNMCFLIASTTPGFIQTNIDKLNRTSFSEAGKSHIAEQAKIIAEKAKTNPKIVLPPEWSQLIHFDVNS